MVAPYILSTNSTANNNMDSITSHIFEYETHPVPLFRTVPVTRSIVVVSSVVGSETRSIVVVSTVVGSEKEKFVVMYLFTTT